MYKLELHSYNICSFKVLKFEMSDGVDKYDCSVCCVGTLMDIRVTSLKQLSLSEFSGE